MGLAHIIDDVQRTQDVQISQDITFDTMMLTPNTLQGLKDSGFYKPSPIQLHGIPLGKCGFDLLLEAKSGTGKTAVFSVITLEKLNLNKGVQSIILSPTREIAAQICDVIKQIGSKYEGLKVEVVIGGLPIQEDVEKLKKPVHVVVGSPGRLRHLIQSEYLDVSAVRLIVLDEADKLMEKSFQTDINYIFSVIPKQKQVIMSSATYPEEAKEFIYKYVQSAQHVCPDSNSVLLGIAQKITIVEYNINIVKQTKLRFEELLQILPKKQFKQCLIFCNYQARVAELYKMLKREKWPAEQLYGQQEQTDRLEALKTLQEYRCRILVSTDLAARGIDASNVDLIINFEPPSDWQTYLHRIGRAGRFGSYGTAITILSEGKEKQKFIDMLKPLQLSLNLNYLWTEKAFIIDSSSQSLLGSSQPSEEIQCQVIPNLKKENNNYKDLWNTLFFKKGYTTEIESFEGLLKSFEEYKGAKMETFSELLNSFENFSQHDSTEIKITKCPRKVPKIPIREYLNYVNNNRTEVDHSSLNKELDIIKNEKPRKENGKLHISNTFSPIKSKEKRTINDRENIVNVFDVKLQDNGDVNNMDDFSYECDDLSKELLKAGLPTSFSSSKNKQVNNKLNLNYKSNKSQAVPKAYKNVVPSDLTKEENGVETVNIVKNKVVISNGNSYDNLDQNMQLNSNMIYDTVNNDRKDYNKSTKNFEASTDYDSHNNTTENLAQNYINWYKKLKRRTQQIELTVYMNEMSKLY